MIPAPDVVYYLAVVSEGVSVMDGNPRFSFVLTIVFKLSFKRKIKRNTGQNKGLYLKIFKISTKIKEMFANKGKSL